MKHAVDLLAGVQVVLHFLVDFAAAHGDLAAVVLLHAEVADDAQHPLFADDFAKLEARLRRQRGIPRDGVWPLHEPAHVTRRARVDGNAADGAFSQHLQGDLFFVFG